MKATNYPYDVGYKACPCFWGRNPGSYLQRLVSHLGSVRDLTVIDLGCGEGKNAAFLASLGARVIALEISPYALKNARTAWNGSPNLLWIRSDVRELAVDPESFDIVVLYGLLHCLNDREEVQDVVRRSQLATKEGGFHVLCSFNDRQQDLTAHPDFKPVLMSHQSYLDFYREWFIIDESDSDLWEIHPHNNVYHRHSMTRIIARKMK